MRVFVILSLAAAVAANRFTHLLRRRNDSRAHIEARGCEADDGSGFYCDPIAIFVGRGHTGSANLAAFLQSHPDLDFGSAKEHRWFTRKKRPLDVSEYRREFAPATSRAAPPFGLDASPAYPATFLGRACFR